MAKNYLHIIYFTMQLYHFLIIKSFPFISYIEELKFLKNFIEEKILEEKSEIKKNL